MLLITVFLGGLGGHKFYLRKSWYGVAYLLFSWTAIPALIGLVEFVVYAFTSPERLRAKYPAGTSSRAVVVLACALGGVVVVSIILAIALPAFLGRGTHAYEALLKVELVNVIRAEKLYFQDHNTYSDRLEALNLRPSGPEVLIRITRADGQCFEVQASHPRVKRTLLADCHGLKVAGD